MIGALVQHDRALQRVIFYCVGNSSGFAAQLKRVGCTSVVKNVHFLSTFCPLFVHFLSTFVHFLSTFCPLFVHFLSSLRLFVTESTIFIVQRVFFGFHSAGWICVTNFDGNSERAAQICYVLSACLWLIAVVF